MNKKFRKGVSILCIGFMLTTGVSGCGVTGSGKQTVPVQSVSSLLGMNMAGANAFGGVVESKTTQAIQKDSDKTVKKCNVKVGDQVKPGDVLFTYDIDELNLTIQTKRLEIEQIQSNLVSSRNQISELTRERNTASADEKLSYTLEIQEIELEVQESQYNLKTKQAELQKLEKSVGATDVRSEVAGVVQSINENASGGDYDDEYGMYDDSDTSNAYITIMETGSFQIKGTASESSINSLYLDMPVLIKSRTDREKIWNGRICDIKTDSPAPAEQNEDMYYGEENTGESAAKYNFYVDLEDTTDILMGQHVYLIPYEEGTYTEGAITLPANYFLITEEGSWCYVASDDATIEKREVSLSALNEETNTYDVLSGLTADDYIADASTNPVEGTKVVMFDSDDHTVHTQTHTGETEMESDSEPGDEYMDGEGDFSDGDFSEDEFIEEDGMNPEEMNGDVMNEDGVTPEEQNNDAQYEEVFPEEEENNTPAVSPAVNNNQGVSYDSDSDDAENDAAHLGPEEAPRGDSSSAKGGV